MASPARRRGDAGAVRAAAEPGRLSREERLGGTSGNEILTTATAAALTLLLAVEGITIVEIGGLLDLHMFIGMVLIPPVLLKLASTGYRAVRYYSGSRPYREKGPPAPALRLLAPLLVLATIVVFVTGVWLLALGHRSDTVREVHKVSFIVWGVAFAVHFLAHIPRVMRSLLEDWRAARRARVPGSGLRAMLLAASLGGGLALALAVLGAITGWHGGHGHRFG